MLHNELLVTDDLLSDILNTVGHSQHCRTFSTPLLVIGSTPLLVIGSTPLLVGCTALLLVGCTALLLVGVPLLVGVDLPMGLYPGGLIFLRNSGYSRIPEKQWLFPGSGLRGLGLF